MVEWGTKPHIYIYIIYIGIFKLWGYVSLRGLPQPPSESIWPRSSAWIPIFVWALWHLLRISGLLWVAMARETFFEGEDRTLRHPARPAGFGGWSQSNPSCLGRYHQESCKIWGWVKIYTIFWMNIHLLQCEAPKISKLVQIAPISLWFMVLITN